MAARQSSNHARLSNRRAKHTPNPRPDGQRSDTLLPPHQRDFITRVPVTPGVALGTYTSPSNISDDNDHEPFASDYFGQSLHHHHHHLNEPHQAPTSPATPEFENHIVNPKLEPHTNLSGNLISATFTIPYAVQYHKGGDWSLIHRNHQSAHLDSLVYLSSEKSPWNHTVIAWTGEINEVEGETGTSEGENAEDVLKSTSLPSGADSKLKGDSKSDEVFITCDERARLESQLYNDGVKTIPIWLADECDKTNDGVRLRNQTRWRRYAEHDLCALFHYRQHPPMNGRKEDARWEDFQRMNEAFADEICKVYRSGDIVMVHDYYLILLPTILRQRCPDMLISFSLHSPFPTSELVRCLVRRKEILQGPLGANLIAFQAFHYAQHFATCCTRFFGYPANMDMIVTPEAIVNLCIAPAGINATKITSLAWTKGVDEKCTMLRKVHQDKKIIIGCDPLDSLGGVDKKMMAFQRFLERYPQWQGKVVLLQITNPSTLADDDGEEARYSSKVSELVNDINTAYGSLDFMPVLSHSQQLSQDEYFALLRSGDVALITSVRDGISTTGLEYVVCQHGNHGPLIISEFSGTASSLQDAIQINPWDLTQVADELDHALTMSEEQRQEMHDALYKHVMKENMVFWINGILKRLVSVLGAREPLASESSSNKPSTSLKALL